MRPGHRVGLALPLIGLTALTFGLSLVGAVGVWRDYTNGERAITAFLCLMTGLGLGLSVSIAVDRRIVEVPWLRIGAIGALLLVSCGVAVVRRNLIVDGL
ncbi:hypothetical protein HH310_17105 [Actinoplanes sp. TBRC 11911]|uniref:hypothetical protein n=1 Tax=Actinoplanes sp. TBRC 11911 TaxID=2729386 RepID=UPI00145DE292|nr:hypothetical protein [Actinoplanes sp. TBRC 11911]NMO52903.1 hypothetical protein [Actinoplanes sp. TBRC 11911]